MKYNIISSYNGSKEIIDEAKNIKEACYLLKEYRLAFGSNFIIYYKKQRRGL